MDGHQPAQPTQLSAPLATRISLLEQSAFPLLNKRAQEVRRTNSQHKPMKAKRSHALKQSARRSSRRKTSGSSPNS